LGNFKKLHSSLGNNIQALHLNLHTIRNNCANSNSFKSCLCNWNSFI